MGFLFWAAFVILYGKLFKRFDKGVYNHVRNHMIYRLNKENLALRVNESRGYSNTLYSKLFFYCWDTMLKTYEIDFS